MIKIFIPIFVGFLCASFTQIPSFIHADSSVAAAGVSTVINTENNTISKPASRELYLVLGLHQFGLSEKAFDYAWRGYQKLLAKNIISCSRYLTICDFSQSSKQKRLYVIDVAHRKLVINTWVAHGKNSGGEYATRFSNTPESLQSSLGFYVTSFTYSGKHGYSLRLRGVDPGFNDNAYSRNIAIHGAAYVDAARKRTGMFMGRSWGCPAIPQKESMSVISTIKLGTCLFIYHSSPNYLNGSKILNG